jgi:hypothetical protein
VENEGINHPMMICRFCPNAQLLAPELLCRRCGRNLFIDESRMYNHPVFVGGEMTADGHLCYRCTDKFTQEEKDYIEYWSWCVIEGQGI